MRITRLPEPLAEHADLRTESKTTGRCSRASFLALAILFETPIHREDDLGCSVWALEGGSKQPPPPGNVNHAASPEPARNAGPYLVGQDGRRPSAPGAERDLVAKACAARMARPSIAADGLDENAHFLGIFFTSGRQ